MSRVPSIPESSTGSFLRPLLHIDSVSLRFQKRRASGEAKAAPTRSAFGDGGIFKTDSATDAAVAASEDWARAKARSSGLRVEPYPVLKKWVWSDREALVHCSVKGSIVDIGLWNRNWLIFGPDRPDPLDAPDYKTAFVKVLGRMLEDNHFAIEGVSEASLGRARDPYSPWTRAEEAALALLRERASVFIEHAIDLPSPLGTEVENRFRSCGVNATLKRYRKAVLFNGRPLTRFEVVLRRKWTEVEDIISLTPNWRIVEALKGRLAQLQARNLGESATPEELNYSFRLRPSDTEISKTRSVHRFLVKRIVELDESLLPDWERRKLAGYAETGVL